MQVVYSTKATSTGGREGRAATEDGRLSVQLSTPKELGGAGGPGTNPEQLFAAGYAACFHGALSMLAERSGLSLPDASGYTLLETLSQDSAHSFPPVIVYTGRELSADDEQRLRTQLEDIREQELQKALSRMGPDLSARERKVVEASHAALVKSGRFKTIHTELAPASTFYLAEDYHQDYYKKNSVRYNYYRYSCGRDARVKSLWQ